MKKCAVLLAVAAVAASCMAEGQAADAEVCQPQGANVALDAMEALAKADAERELEALIVGGVYGEGSNSSFIVRKELTSTQKRFIAIGRNFLVLTAYAKELEGRVAALEARLKSIDDEAERKRKAREAIAEERKRKEALRRAQERGRRVRGAVR